jgi:hypothetical protein
MDPFITYALAESRREEFVREADTERLARQARRGAKRLRQAEPRPGPRQREVPRAVTA